MRNLSFKSSYGRKEDYGPGLLLSFDREEVRKANFALEIATEEDEERQAFRDGCDVED